MRLLFFACVITIGVRAYAPIHCTTSLGKGLVLTLKQFTGQISRLGSPQELTLGDAETIMSPSAIPHFTAKIDNTIMWDEKGWCLEAKNGPAVQVSRCTGEPSQKWNWVPDGHGRNMIQLRDTNQCLDVIDRAGDLNGATVELRACASKVTNTWTFEESHPLPSKNIMFSVEMRLAVMSLLALVGIGALTLGASTWRTNTTAPTVAMSGGGAPVCGDQGGVSLATPSTVEDGLASSLAFTSEPRGHASRTSGRATGHPVFSVRPTPAASRVSSSAISMNLAERFGRLVSSNVNALLGKLEDPEKVIEQATADMQNDLVKVRQAYAEVSASLKRMEAQRKAAQDEADSWYKRAQLALEKEEEELAREALSRRKLKMESVESLTQQINVQQGSAESLYESMQQLEVKMTEASAKKQQLIARARTAKTATKVNDMLSGVGSSSAMAAFDRMSEKVEQLEAGAEVSQQMALTSGSGAGSTLDRKFKALESGSSVDDELAAMKKALPGGSNKALSGGSSVDDELAAMKKTLPGSESV